VGGVGDLFRVQYTWARGRGRWSCAKLNLLREFAVSVVVGRCLRIGERRDGLLREPCGFQCCLKGYG
jgi:hypothetical protein